MKHLFSLILIQIFPVDSFGQQYPFQNPDLSSEERAGDLISRLTLEEKPTLMCDQSDAILHAWYGGESGGQAVAVL